MIYQSFRSHKRIIFLLPSRANTPVGGYKVVYEYSNRLALDGRSVLLLYPANLELSPIGALKKIRGIFRYLKILFSRTYSCNDWFRLNPDVKEIWIPDFGSFRFKTDDYIVATAGQTAAWLLNSNLKNEKLFYLIQHYEDWIDKEILDATWRSSLKKIVIADWLLDIAHKYDTTAELIENGLDFDTFGIDIPMHERHRKSVAMLWHFAENKGSSDGLEAVLILKNKYPDLEASFFGTSERPLHIPDWICYVRQPKPVELRKLYNSAAVFIAPSRAEGFGLTAAEAMQCGCAVASTNAGGFLQFCKDGKTALVSSILNPSELAENVSLFFESAELTERIATDGNVFISGFTWEKAYNKLINCFSKL